MRNIQSFIVIVFICFNIKASCQPKGSLFIIGGGHKSKELMQALVATAQLSPHDFILILPMASSEPDTSFYYIKQDFQSVCNNAVINCNVSKNDIDKKGWTDSIQHAKLIFITGGDQSRFMNIVLHTPFEKAIENAYQNGATIAGTSAGAALMSYHMITGNQLSGDTTYAATFSKLLVDNIEIKQGLHLLDSAIIDMHFIVRSRYNRLLSAIAKYPTLPCIGIDEGTAIIVHNNEAKVVGDNQVVLIKNPEHLSITNKKQIKFRNVQFSIYTAGDSFLLH